MVYCRPARRRPHCAIAQFLEPRRLLAAVPFDGFTAPADAVLGPAVELGGFAYFFSRDTALPAGAQRVELYKTDGTPAGTASTGVSFPFPADGAQGSMVVFGGKLLFDAIDPTLGRELWVSDGTPEGTTVASAFADPLARPLNLTALNDQAFFTLQENATGRELWRTDGTPGGTRIVADLLPGPENSGATSFTPFNDRLYFVAVGDAPVRDRIWSTDGTAAGTEPLVDLFSLTPALRSQLHVGPTPAGPRLFFNAAVHDTSVGNELWASDGTPAGTYLVKDIDPGSSDPAWFTSFGGAVHFVARDSTGGREIWRTDGTADGTVRVTDVVPGSGTIDPHSLTAAGGRLYFTGSASGSGLWSTDGTAAGARRVATPDGITSFNPNQLRAVGGRVFFTTRPAPIGVEPWVSDGTDAGTIPLRDIAPGAANSFPQVLAGVGEKLVFAAFEPLTGAAPWVTDGTPTGTTLLRRLAGEVPVTVTQLHPVGDTLYAFGRYTSARHGTMHGVWRTDGTPAGTRPLYLGTSAFFPQPRWVQPAGQRLYFGAADVWTTDGTAAGTEMLHAGPIPTDPAHRTAVVGGVLYFATQAGTGAPNELWKSDGTPAGTVRVKEFGATPFERGYPPGHFAPIGQRMFFLAADEQHGFEPWITDGTDAGTAMIEDVYPGASSSTLGEYVLVAHAGGKVYFLARDGVHGSALWVSDGTADGTRFVKDLDPQAAVPQLRGFPTWAADGNVLYFAGPGPSSTNAIWRTDGTEAGTWVVAGGMAAPVTDLVAWRGNLYFAFGPSTSSTNPLVPGTLYRSNGMPGNATPLRAFLTVTPLDPPQNLVAAPDGVYFHARDATANRSLWRTNGTPAGTVAVHTPAQSPDMTPPVPFKGRVWFAERGRPWVVDPPPPVAGRHVFYNNSVADGREPAANFIDDAAIDHAKRALLPGGRAAFANLTSYHRGINGVMVDLSNVPAAAVLSADDFELHTGNGTTWTPLSTAPTVALRRAAGVTGTDRVTLTLPEGLVKNTWLRVTARATADTGLSAPDVFYFGNLVGDVGTNAGGVAVVDRLDLARVRARRASTSDATRALFDINRDGFVSLLDFNIVRANQGRRLSFFTPA